MPKKKKKIPLIKKIPSILCSAEAGKSEVKIGDARSVVKLLSILLAMDPQVAYALQKNGFRLLSKKPGLGKSLKAKLAR